MRFIRNVGPWVEIGGIATLCFNEDGTRFQGSISAEDDAQFAIYGNKSQSLMDEQDHASSQHCECPPAEEGPGLPVTFDIRVVDCEVGEEYYIKRVHGWDCELGTFSCSSISFTTHEVFRGHKADMISQHCLGHKMAGNRTVVYQGPMKLTCGTISQNGQWVL